MNKLLRGVLGALAVVALALLVIWATGNRGLPGTSARPSAGVSVSGKDSESGLPWVAQSALPKEARDTLALIDQGGPYPYPKNDDQTFSNAERILPKKERGYYREYTVKTPGSRDRGARRIVKGERAEFYYTDDHYQTFARIKR